MENEFDLSDPSDLRGELAKLRQLIDQAEGNPGLIKSLCDSVTRAASEYHRMQFRMDRYIHVEALNRWGELFITRVNQELDILPEKQRNQIVDNLLQWLADPANAPGNTDQEVVNLIGRQR